MKLEASRKKMKIAMEGVNKNNLEILDQLTLKRHQGSLLLNYTNFAERQLKDKMSKNIDNVEKLLNDLTQRISV
jgi:Zn-dependent oligopeptidase